MNFTHTYRKASSIAIEKNGITYILGHSIKFDPWVRQNACNIQFVDTDGVVCVLDTITDCSQLDKVANIPEVIYNWVHARLYPESIELGIKLSRRLCNQAKIIKEYCEAPHVIYGVTREFNGQLRTFFKPCTDEELLEHARNTKKYVYAVHTAKRIKL